MAHGVKGRRRWRRAVAMFALLVAAASLVVVVQPLWAFDVLRWAAPRIVWRVDTTQPLVALTFDDGPSPAHTPRVLEILARHGARATFFLIGERAAAHPEMVATLRAAGHEIGNHAFTIRSTRGATDQAFLENLRRTEATLGLAGPLKLFRPPGGKIRSHQLALLQGQGYRCVLGSAYPYDGQHPPAAYIEWLITKNLAPGVVVILHDGIPDPTRSIQALEPVLAAGKRKGLRFVSVGELLAAAGPPAVRPGPSPPAP